MPCFRVVKYRPCCAPYNYESKCNYNSRGAACGNSGFVGQSFKKMRICGFLFFSFSYLMFHIKEIILFIQHITFIGCIDFVWLWLCPLIILYLSHLRFENDVQQYTETIARRFKKDRPIANWPVETSIQTILLKWAVAVLSATFDAVDILRNLFYYSMAS